MCTAEVARQRVAEIVLAALSERDVADWLGARHDLVSSIYARTNGNPFFVRELIELIGDGDASQVRSVPPGVQAVVRRRVSDLDGSAAKSALHRGRRRIPVRSGGHRRDDRPRQRTGRRRGAGWARCRPAGSRRDARLGAIRGRDRGRRARRRSGTLPIELGCAWRPHARSPAAIPVTTTLRRLRPTQQPARLTIRVRCGGRQACGEGRRGARRGTQRQLGIGRSRPR